MSATAWTAWKALTPGSSSVSRYASATFLTFWKQPGLRFFACILLHHVPVHFCKLLLNPAESPDRGRPSGISSMRAACAEKCSPDLPSCCEQDYRDELATPECKSQVHKLSERASQDVRFDEPLADACYEDRNKLCDGVQPASGRPDCSSCHSAVVTSCITAC